jgi:hypothetical protein
LMLTQKEFAGLGGESLSPVPTIRPDPPNPPNPHLYVLDADSQREIKNEARDWWRSARDKPYLDYPLADPSCAPFSLRRSSARWPARHTV